MHRKFRIFITIGLVSWGLFLVYGSLLPLEFRGEHSQKFLNINFEMAHSITDILTNIGIFIPLSLFSLGALQSKNRDLTKPYAAVFVLLFCIVFSLSIEWLQIYFPPRKSSFIDVISNSIGSMIGIFVWFAFGKRSVQIFERNLLMHKTTGISRTKFPGNFIFICFTINLIVIFAWAGFFSENWLHLDSVNTKWESAQLLPFLAHQKADIFRALASVVMAGLCYSILGILISFSNWLCNLHIRLQLVVVTFVCSLISFKVECLKFFLIDRNPETGNVIIAGICGCVGYFVAPLIYAYISSTKLYFPLKNAQLTEEYNARLHSSTFRFKIDRILSVLSGCLIFFLVLTYPISRLQLFVFLLLYALVLLRFSCAWLVILPALLPIFDFTQWTGRQLLDEFDAVLLMTLFVGLWRYAGQPVKVSSSNLTKVILTAFLISYFISVATSLLPIQSLNENSFSSPYSNYSALFIAKGIVFAIGIFLLIGKQSALDLAVDRYFSAGMVFGLLFASLSVIWERFAYTSLGDFNETFRVAGLFSSMNTGGPHLDAFLISAFPFVLMLAIQTKNYGLKILYYAILACGTYAVMMTFSRAAFASLIIIILIILAWHIFLFRRENFEHRTRGMSILITSGALCAIIVPVLLGTFMQSRLAITSSDLYIRINNWSEAMNIMNDKWTSKLFGMGIGRYPVSYQLLAANNNRPAIHVFEKENENIFLRIGNGSTIYVEQIVSPKPNSEYQLTLHARTLSEQGKLNVLLCDRTFLIGFNCESVTLIVKKNNGKWQSFNVTLNSRSVGGNKFRLSKLSFENGGSTAPIDIDNISIHTQQGSDLLFNGDFQVGSDFWYFSSPNNYSPWRVENIFLQVLFEQGWLGFILFSILVTVTITRLVNYTVNGSAFAVSILASFLGIIIIGTFDSMFDSPRLVLLLGLLVVISTNSNSYSNYIELFNSISIVNYAGIHQEKPQFYCRITNYVKNIVFLNYPFVKILFSLVGKLTFLSIAISVVVKIPFIPYNIRELVNPHHAIISPIIIATFLIWVFGIPTMIARWCTASTTRGVYLPVLLIIHGVIAWILLQNAVLPESVHDIIGSPVLNWPDQIEYIYRFIPFISVFTLQLLGGILFSNASFGRLAAARIWWVVTSFIFVPIQYLVIVKHSATDNLTELLADNASFTAFLLISAYIFMLGYVCSKIVTYKFHGGMISVLKVIFLLVLSLPIAYLLVSSGTSDTIIKENKLFSTLQFLLSPNREEYVSGFVLLINFAVAHYTIVGLLVFTFISNVLIHRGKLICQVN